MGFSHWIVVVVLLAFVPETSLADRKPTPEERTVIERALRSKGYRAWADIEIEKRGRVWEVDGALDRNGRRYDLKIRADTLRIIKRKRD
jgi:hypothetical protein